MTALEILRQLALAGNPNLSFLIDDLVNEVDASEWKIRYYDLKAEYNSLSHENKDLRAKYDAVHILELTEKRRKLMDDAMAMDQFKLILKDQGKIQSIKYLRSISTLGLKEAKDFMDDMIALFSLPVGGNY